MDYRLFYLLWASPPWIVLVLRIAASPNFLYVCSEAVTAKHVSLDVFTYITMVLPTFPWGDMIQSRNTPSKRKDLIACLIAAMLLTVAIVVLQMLVYFSVIEEGCENCPKHGQADEHLQCGAFGDDFFYNALNFCRSSIEQQCERNKTEELPDISHCPLYGCSIKLLPLQTVLFWLQFATLSANLIVYILMLQNTHDTLRHFRLPTVPTAPHAAENLEKPKGSPKLQKLPRLSLSPLRRAHRRTGYARLPNVHDI